jgi:alpha-L-rhamnosidase
MRSAPVDLRTDTRVAPLGIGSAWPELSWRLPEGSEPQVAYAVEVRAGGSFGSGELVWESGRVDGDWPAGIRYAGARLDSGTAYSWQVRVWCAGEDAPGPWSEPAVFETGILDPGRWRAQWISGPAPAGKADYTTLYLRGTAELAADVTRGRAYVSALGWYRFFVNGADLTGPALVPRWTPFDSMVEYQVYDVTSVFRAGVNVLAMAVGDGRYRGRNGAFSRQAVYGDQLAGLAQIELELADGSSALIATGPFWQAGTGRIVTADPKFGERADLRIPDEDWLTGTAAPGRFSAAEAIDRPRTLIAEETGRVREVARLTATSVTRTPSGKQVVDFGQNFAGVARIRLAGASGTTVRLTHSELLGPGGELDLDYLQIRQAGRWYQRDEVALNGEPAWYQPWFTIHGFRYLEVDGLKADLAPADVEGVVLSSDLEEAGSFGCSDPRLVQLYSNVAWSLRSNFTDTPTDCPTRERSGWTGDIQVFAATATTFVDAQAYLRRYLRNLAAEQHADGTVPPFIPTETSQFSGGVTRAMKMLATAAGWGDASVLLPWTLYRYYGDRTVLETQYASMTAWVDQMARRARGKRGVIRRIRGTGEADVERYILDTGFHWGEWLRPGESFAFSVLDSQLRSRPVVATAYLEHSARVLAGIAALLGRDDDAARYRALADRVRSAWRAAFLRSDSRVGLDRQDDYVRALAFGLLDPRERVGAAGRLAALIEEAGDHLATGFLSTPMLLPVLADAGRADLAWRLLLQTTSPSWLYQVQNGATTTWETWGGTGRKGRAAHSRNHYAFGAVAGFLIERVAGLAPAEPGYRVIDVRPLIGGGLTFARGRVRTPYGTAISSWRHNGDQVHLEVTVPPGAVARVHTGADGIRQARGGTHTFHWRASLSRHSR